MDKKTNNTIRRFISAFAKENPNIVKAFIFGSFARNSERPESDIDIAIIIKNLNDNDKFKMQVQLMLFASNFDLRIEPHPISSEDFEINNPFVDEIKRTGIEIKI